jgi:hypothetical protein
MSALTHSKQVFLARIEARAALFAEGAEDLIELLRGIEAAADQFVGAVIEQHAGESTFVAASREADAAAKQQQQKHLDTKRSKQICVTASTLGAAEYLVREGDAKRLRTWLDQHSLTEALAISKHIRRYRDKRRGQQCPTTK